MYGPIFIWVWRKDYKTRAKKTAVFHSHTDFDTELFGLDRGSDDTAIWRVVSDDGDGLVPQKWIGLLLDGGKAGIEINVHDGGGRSIEAQINW